MQHDLEVSGSILYYLISKNPTNNITTTLRWGFSHAEGYYGDDDYSTHDHMH